MSDEKPPTSITDLVSLGDDKDALFSAAIKMSGATRSRAVVEQMSREISLLREYEDRKMIVEMGIDHRRKKIDALQHGEYRILPPGDLIVYNDATLNSDIVTVGGVQIGL